MKKIDNSNDASGSISFLKTMSPDGPWNLTAINSNGPGIETRSFDATQTRESRRWIDEQNGRRMNIYFSVGDIVGHLNKKATKKDIARIRWLWVDIDPDYANGQSVEEAVEKALDMLSSGKDGIPPPTMIVFSGGGIQAYWKLKIPIRIDGDLDLAAEVESNNRYLEKVFGADHCHNVDRILRVPDTTNWPNDKKRKFGREPALAEVLEFNPNLAYDISVFPQLEPDKAGTSQSKRPPSDIVIPDSVIRLKDIDELNQWNVSDRIKPIIVHGRHPDEGLKEKDDSRSAWLFDVLCELVRRGVPNVVIHAIITDPAFRISESVLEKPDPDAYSNRQIERASWHAIDPHLQELNDRHAVICNYGNKCVVVEMMFDPVLGRSYLSAQLFEDFKRRYCNRQVQIGSRKNGNPVYVDLGKWWLANPDRREYDRIVFAPNQDVPGALNLWEGFSVKATAGDWSLFRHHMLHIVCGGDKDCFEYLIRWMARCVQEPESSGQIAIVLRGDKGCGKSLFVEIFGRLFGQHFLMTAVAEHVAGRFNDHLQTVVVLFGDEAFFAGDKNHERVLKALVTQDELSFEGKHRPVKVGRNHVHLMLASNSTWVVPAHGKERRFLVLDVSGEKIDDRAYFSGIVQQMKNGGSEAMLHELLRLDLKDFEVRDIPKTTALREQQQESARFEETAMVDILTDGYTPDHERYGCEPNEISSAGLLEFAMDSGLVGSLEGRHSSLTRLGHFINKLARIDLTTGKPVYRTLHCDIEGRKSRRKVYELRPLEELRKEFDYLVGPEGWPDSPAEWTDASATSDDDPPF
jgi:hypothetical protein